MVNLSWSGKSSSIHSMSSSSSYYASNNNNQSTIQNTRVDDKIESVTAGLQDYYVRLLKKQSSQNAKTIPDYIFAMNIEVNPSMHHRSSQIRTLAIFQSFINSSIYAAKIKLRARKLKLRKYNGVGPK